MPRTPSVRPQRSGWTGTRQWKVDLPASISPTGKRQRFFFETKSDADLFAEKERIRVKNFGAQSGTILSPAELDQAAAALAAIKPFGVALNEVVRDWIARRKARETTATFAEAGEQFQSWLEVRKIKGRPVSSSHRKRVRQTLARLADLADLKLTDIDDHAISAAVAKMPGSVRNATLAVLSALFSWAAETPRKWVRENPVKLVKREDEGGGEVQIFTVRQVLRVLVACRRSDPEVLPYHIFGFFAGIRPEELSRMRWDMVDVAERHIVLPASVTKTGARRVIEIEAALADWLQWWQASNPERPKTIAPQKNLRRRLRAVRDKARVPWIQDGMRHTYASNWLAIHGDEHKLRANMGHRSADELWEHYHRAVTKREAEKFWAIRPKSRPAGNVIKMKIAA